ncbi:ornithine cyclodeaminase family protein [Brucella cytisi]|uniref:ornithine cyclodeaminase family protein n=1 Tax=Brucella cytisi TaxID=407152 RepID=UPI0035D7B636
MVLIVDRADTLECLELGKLVDEIGDGMAALSRGGAIQPLRTRVFSSQTGGLLASLPCYLSGEELFSAKLGFSHPALRDANGTRHLTQIIALGDTEGRLLSVMHGTLLGMYRTAACSALAAKFLSPLTASHLAVIGCGPMGQAEAEVMATVRPLKAITVHDLNPRAAENFQKSVEAKTGVPVTICASNQEAVDGAHLVSLATTAHDPVIKREWLVANCHVSALGAHRKDQREVDSATMTEAAVIVESKEALLAEAGDYLIPISEGRYPVDHFLAEIGELVDGKHAQQSFADKLTLFKSTGVGVQDLIIARHVYQRALDRGVGIEVDF